MPYSFRQESEAALLLKDGILRALPMEFVLEFPYFVNWMISRLFSIFTTSIWLLNSCRQKCLCHDGVPDLTYNFVRFEAHVKDFCHIKIQSWNTIVQIILITQRMISLFGQIWTKKRQVSVKLSHINHSALQCNQI